MRKITLENLSPGDNIFGFLFLYLSYGVIEQEFRC